MASDEQMEALNGWAAYMPRLDEIPDRELLVLKIHLLAEKALFHLLSLRLGLETDLSKNVRLQFAQLSHVALAGKSLRLREAIECLNAARNGAAHRLDDDEFDRKVNAFVQSAKRLPSGLRVITSDDAVEVVRQAGNHAISAIYDEASPHWNI